VTPNKMLALAPSTLPATLLRLADHYPDEVLRNPVLPLLALEDPELWGLIRHHAAVGTSKRRRSKAIARFGRASTEQYQEELLCLGKAWLAEGARAKIFRLMGWRQALQMKTRELMNGCAMQEQNSCAPLDDQALRRLLDKHQKLTSLAERLAAGDRRMGRPKAAARRPEPPSEPHRVGP